MEDRQLQKSEFVREQIKDKPLNKKRVVHRMGLAAVCGVTFALAACGVFALLLPGLMQRKPVQSVYGDTESQTDTQPATETEIIDTQPPIPQETEIKVELTLEDYQKLQNQLYDVGKKANRSIVSVTGVISDTDIFYNNYETEGLGSGVIIADNGTELLILTERKVISDASRVSVTFINETVADAVVKKYDGNTGIAILAVDKKPLGASTLDAITVAEFCDSKMISSGSLVIALGSPLGTSYSILTGNITSTSNEIFTEDHNYSVYTTDIVASETGSGVLINVEGQVIGVVMQEYGESREGNTLTAVVISELKPVIEQLSAGKDIPYLGLQVSTVTSQIEKKYNMPKGVYIREVTVDSPAMQAGLQSGDVMVSVNGKKITTVKEYSSEVLKLPLQTAVPVVVKRQGANGYSEITCQVEAGVLP